MIPVVFSALAMNSVGKAAMDMVNEVRRQFREIPGILEGTGKPEYGKCVEISTKAALREMLLPGVITIVTPIIIGVIMGAEALGAYMAGVTVSGVLWAIFQNNAGGAWDNAKKSFEKGVEIEVNGKKEMFYKKSEPHKAAVVGDTVGDPFKDTSGPSMNILIKLSSLVGLTIAPLIAIQTETISNPEQNAVAKTVVMEAPADLKSLKGIYVMDVSHSSIDFSLRHFVATSKGAISLDTASKNIINLTGDLSTSSVEMSIEVNTINTMSGKRDEHLKEAGYFDTRKFPKIIFKSASIKENKGGTYKYSAVGTITIKGISKQIEIPFNYMGETSTKYDGNTYKISAFDGEVIIKRSDFGISPGSVSIGDDVTISFSIEAGPQEENKTA